MQSLGHSGLAAAKPKNRAVALRNLRTVLQSLRLDPKMPARHLWSHEALVRCEPGEAEGLLWDMFAVQQSLL